MHIIRGNHFSIISFFFAIFSIISRLMLHIRPIMLELVMCLVFFLRKLKIFPLLFLTWFNYLFKNNNKCAVRQMVNVAN